RRPLFEPGGAYFDAEPTEQRALRDWTMHAGSGAHRGVGERREVDMSGQVHLARRSQRIDEAVPADCLQRLAWSALDMTIVDHEGRATGAHHTSGKLGCRMAGAPFVERADRHFAQRQRQYRIEVTDWIGVKREREIIVGVHRDHTLVPAICGAHRLMHRERVEELIGYDNDRHFRQL